MNVTDNSNATVDSLQCTKGFVPWTCLTLVSFVLGVPGAVVILLDMFQKGRKGTPFTPNDVFMINLTIMDGLYLFFLQPELYSYVHLQSSVYDKIIAFIYSFSLCGRPLLIACICLDAYLAVVHPVTYHAKKSLTPRVLMAVAVWIVTVTFGGYMTSVREKMLTDTTPIMFFVLALPVAGFCDFSILWTLTRSSPGGRNIHPQKKRALQIITNNLVVTIITYLPTVITLLIVSFSPSLQMDKKNILCLVIVPLMRITTLGNTVSLILYLNSLGKLEWIKCCKVK